MPARLYLYFVKRRFLLLTCMSKTFMDIGESQYMYILRSKSKKMGLFFFFFSAQCISNPKSEKDTPCTSHLKRIIFYKKRVFFTILHRLIFRSCHHMRLRKGGFGLHRRAIKRTTIYIYTAIQKAVCRKS